MSSRNKISINSVLLDLDNARHGEKYSQKEIYAWMTEGLIGQKVIRLASEIAQEGISPLETPGVIPAPDESNKPWIVVEGNRRVAALKFLNNPKLCPDPKLRKQYERLRSTAWAPVPTKIEFVVFENINAARYWIKTRHGGENGGAGIIDWGPGEFYNFEARFGKSTANRPAVEMLNYAYSKGLIGKNDNKTFPVTTLQRLLNSPTFREAIGCSVVNKQLFQIANDIYFDRAVATVLEILASGQKTVTDLKSRKQREDFADEIKQAGGWSEYEPTTPRPVTLGADVGERQDQLEQPETEDSSVESKPKAGVTRTRSGARERLFTAKDHGLKVPSTEAKVNDILRELVTLKHSGSNGTPISVAFLLRALVELSSDNYLKNNPDAIKRLESNTSLRDKVKYSARHMHNRGNLTADRLEVITRHCDQEGGMLNISTLQKYLHSTAFFPNGESLNSMWSEIKDYVIGCW